MPWESHCKNRKFLADSRGFVWQNRKFLADSRGYLICFSDNEMRSPNNENLKSRTNPINYGNRESNLQPSKYRKPLCSQTNSFKHFRTFFLVETNNKHIFGTYRESTIIPYTVSHDNGMYSHLSRQTYLAYGGRSSARLMWVCYMVYIE